MLSLLFFTHVCKIWCVGNVMDKLRQSIYIYFYIYGLLQVVIALFRLLLSTDTAYKAGQNKSFNKCCEILYF